MWGFNAEKPFHRALCLGILLKLSDCIFLSKIKFPV